MRLSGADGALDVPEALDLWQPGHKFSRLPLIALGPRLCGSELPKYLKKEEGSEVALRFPKAHIENMKLEAFRLGSHQR